MIRPDVLKPLPSPLTSVLGAIVATILFAALLNLAPLLGGTFVDLPRLLGGIFVVDADTVFWLGYALFLFIGFSGAPPLMVQLWLHLPGRPLGFRGAVAKGLTAGAAMWFVAGLLLPLLELISRANIGTPYGFFAVSAGVSSALWFLIAHLAYGLTFAVIAIMTNGLKPIDTLGWNSHRHGDVREAALGLPHPGGTGIYISTEPT